MDPEWHLARHAPGVTFVSRFPSGWDEERVRRILDHYEDQNEDEVVAEDEASFEDRTQTVMEVPNDLVPTVRELIAKRSH